MSFRTIRKSGGKNSVFRSIDNGALHHSTTVRVRSIIIMATASILLSTHGSNAFHWYHSRGLLLNNLGDDVYFHPQYYGHQVIHHHQRRHRSSLSSVGLLPPSLLFMVSSSSSVSSTTSTTTTNKDSNDENLLLKSAEGLPSLVPTTTTTAYTATPLSSQSCPKLRRLKDRLWVRETLEDLTSAEFAYRVEQHNPTSQQQQPTVTLKKRAMDFENILGKLERRLDEMCLVTTISITNNITATIPAEYPNRKNYTLVDGKGLGSVVYTHEQREALMGKLLSAHHKIFMAIHATRQKQEMDDVRKINTTSLTSSLPRISGASTPIREEQDIMADLDSIRIQLQANITTTTATTPKETQQQQATPKLYVREDGTVDWEGALQDQAALKLFGTAVWARINGQDPTEVSEGRIVQQNHPHAENEKKKNVTASIQETVAIREERDRLQSLQKLLQTVEERHTALLSSAIQTGAVTANVNLASIPADLRTKIRESTRELDKVRERVAFQKLVYDLERIYVYLDGEIGTTRAGGSVPLQDRLTVAEFGLFESQVEALRNQLMYSGEAPTATSAVVEMEDDVNNWRIDSDVLLVLVDQLNDFKGRLGIDYYVTGLTLDSDAIKRWLMDLWMQTKKGVAFYVKGCQLLANDLVYCGSLIGRAITQGYTLKPREVRTLRRTFKDVLTFIPFVIILIIPLSPIGHVLVFGAIQRFFPDFFPSCFTERRQNLLQLYERTEYTEVVMDEPWQKKLVRLGEAAAYVIAEGFRRLWKLISSEGDTSSTDVTIRNTKDE